MKLFVNSILSKIHRKWVWFVAAQAYHTADSLAEYDVENLYLLKLQVDAKLRGKKIPLTRKVEIKKYHQEISK